MLTVKDIASTDILALVSYQQPYPNAARITILRGGDFYARCVNDRLQQWTGGDTDEHSKELYSEALLFEEKLGSTPL